MRKYGSLIHRAVFGALMLAGAALRAQSGGGVLKGRVTGPTGEPLPGASVSASGTRQATVARSDGTFQLALPAGRYEIRARLLGYSPSAESVTVTAGATMTKNFSCRTSRPASRPSRFSERVANSERSCRRPCRSTCFRRPTSCRPVAPKPRRCFRRSRRRSTFPARRSATAPITFGPPRFAVCRPIRR